MLFDLEVFVTMRKQLGWNCFDIAVGIKRSDLVKYALDKSRSLEFRQLLAPEIRHAATLAVMDMNQEKEVAEKTNQMLKSLLDAVEDGVLDPDMVSQEVDDLLTQKMPIQNQHALPKEMQNQELQDMVNSYGGAFERMRAVTVEINDLLSRPAGTKLSISELDDFFSDLGNNTVYWTVSQKYKTARQTILTPVETKFLEYSIDENTYRTYINEYYAKEGWVAFQRQFAGERSTSMVDIAARMLNVTIIILQPTNNELTEIYRTSNFSKAEKRIVFNGVDHFESYEEYIIKQPIQKKDTSGTDEVIKNLSKLNLGKQITCEELLEKIEFLINNVDKEKLSHKAFAVQLKKMYDEVEYYFSHPKLILRGSYHAGIETIKQRYAPELLRISLFVSRSLMISKEEAQVVNKGLTHVAKLYKIRRAYNDIYKGKKFIAAGLGRFDSQHPISQVNPIMHQSRKNIKFLITKLKTMNGDANHLYGLRDDEISLFSLLLNLPFRLQHATNHYYPALNSGNLGSYTELQRYMPEYESPFSTKGNIDKLGNGGFVFFRFYVAGINSEQTRYGDSSLIFDLNVLRKFGWVSLHDQLNPFPSKSPSTRHLYWDKRLIRTSTVYPLEGQAKSDKGLYAGLEYNYRQSRIASYGSGKKDTLKSFGDGITTHKRKTKFTSEIFYGPDILIGIALTVIRELRFLEASGFRQTILHAVANNNNAEVIRLLGELIKGLFRIEGKYPVALRLQADMTNKSQFFLPIHPSDQRKKIDREFEIFNPDGDGRYGLDMSINSEALRIAEAKQNHKYYSDRISMLWRQRARYAEDAAQHQELSVEITQTENEIANCNSIIEGDIKYRKELIQELRDLCDVEKKEFSKIDTTKIAFIHDNFSELLQQELVDIFRLLNMPFQQLILIAEEEIIDLLIDELTNLDELAKCSIEELEAFSQYNISFAILERGMTITELRKLYSENPDHLEYITCEDLDDLVLQEAPDLPALLLEYARNYDVDLEWVMDELCESEQLLFRIRLGLDEDYEEDPFDGDEQYDEEEYYNEVSQDDAEIHGDETQENFDDETDDEADFENSFDEVKENTDQSDTENTSYIFKRK